MLRGMLFPSEDATSVEHPDFATGVAEEHQSSAVVFPVETPELRSDVSPGDSEALVNAEANTRMGSKQQLVCKPEGCVTTCPHAPEYKSEWQNHIGGRGHTCGT